MDNVGERGEIIRSAERGERDGILRTSGELALVTREKTEMIIIEASRLLKVV